MAAIYNPKFRPTILIRGGSYFLASIPWLVSVFVSSEYREALWWSSAILDRVLSIAAMLLTKIFDCKYRVALNIEHHTERLGLLTLVVLGTFLVLRYSFNSVYQVKCVSRFSSIQMIRTFHIRIWQQAAVR